MNEETIYIVVPTTPYRRVELARLIESIREHTKDMKYAIVTYENLDGGWVPAVHNAIAGLNGFVILLGDDIVVEAGWLSTLWGRFCEVFPNKDGCAQPYDEINHGRLCQHPLAHSSLLKEYIYKGFTHNFSDNDLTDLLLRDNKYLYVPEAKIEHRHFVNGKAPRDKTYEIVFNKENWAKDQALYQKRKLERENNQNAN